MKIFKRSVYAVLLALGLAGTSQAADYGLPSGVQEGNILHCFDWTVSDVKAELANIAAAGFGSVQLSPMQRSDVRTGSSWHDLYRPYDLAFKGGIGTEAELKDLCQEAANYGIKIIVDVVANHVDKTAGYHDTWWDSNGRVRWEGGINYGDRKSITHGQLGDYGDINSESSEVIARGKAYIEKLASLGVKGIRWDAAKHIGLPSEGCGFWSAVTSVPGLYHYGEILNTPGPNSDIIKEYGQYMSVTDNRYSNYAARENGGIPGGYGGDWAVNYGMGKKVVYWAESHDTYANDEWSQNVDQSVIDRAYAAYACRNEATALYFSRPNTKGFNNIKVGKGSTHFTSKQVAEVNKFRNKMVGREDYFSSNGNACSITRKDGGAVIVMKGSGNISIENGGGYCPAGTYTDRVSGGTFTVTASTITGNVGSSGIAVIYDGSVGPEPPTPPTPGTDLYILGNLEGTAGWSTTPGTGVAMTANGTTYTAKGVKFVAAAGETTCYFNLTDKVGATWDDLNMTANRYGAATEGEAITLGTPATIVKYALNVDASGCLSWTIPAGTYDLTADLSTMKLTVVKAGDDPEPPTPGTETVIYYDNSNTKWSNVNIHYWNTPNTTWPGVKMTKAEGNLWKYTFDDDVSKLTGFLFCDGSGSGDANQTADYVGVPVNKHIYKGAGGNKGAVSDEGLYQDGDDPEKPVVTASPASGTRFTDNLTVTLTVTPAATIYYTLNGQAATTSSTKYTTPIALTETTTINTLAVTSEGAQNAQSFSYTKGQQVDPPTPGTSLKTNYYKVNPDGKSGTFKTINVTGHPATNALSNWTENELIAQGVARDVCMAFNGTHERPVIDSYAIYAAYDNDNLYLGVQTVYTVWNDGMGGPIAGESKPYNMDGRLMWAFDLDPDKSFDGYIDGTKAIWNDNNQPGAKFDNGVDAVFMGSTKPGVGTPGFFIPTPDGHASYDAAYCKTVPANSYGYKDGLLPSITNIWGQNDFGYDPELLKGNDGFTDIRATETRIGDSDHTFYEFKFPLSLLGITADYIKNTGIGVMFLDVYGSSPVGGTPYDPAYFDNVFDEYSQDDSTSHEKEDEDVITYAPARVGKISTVGVSNIGADFGSDETPVYFNLQGVQVAEPTEGGVYIVRRGNKVTKEVIR